MRVVSWNIQAAQGCDGRNSMADILALLHAQNADVICLQEVARHLPEHGNTDQLDTIRQYFAGFTPVWAPGFSWQHPEGRSEFGNLTLVRSTLLVDARTHLLPAPVSSEHLQMPRTAAEVVVTSASLMLRIFNTHLAFHCAQERREQLVYLSAQKTRAEQQALRRAPAGSKSSYRQPPSPAGVLLCGDLNLTPDSDDYQFLLAQGWLDSWHICHGDQTHAPTCGVFDKHQWPEGPHCRDFGLLNHAAALSVTDIDAEQTCDASDHQPLILEFYP